MSREIPYELDLVCDSCGKVGAFDFMGDALCTLCSSSFVEKSESAQTKEELEKLKGTLK